MYLTFFVRIYCSTVWLDSLFVYLIVWQKILYTIWHSNLLWLLCFVLEDISLQKFKIFLSSSKMRSMNSFLTICVHNCFIDYCIIWWCCCACVNLLIVIKNLNGIYCMYQLHIKFVLRSSMNINRKFL